MEYNESMKRMICLCLALFLLCGCGAPAAQPGAAARPTATPTAPAPTEEVLAAPQKTPVPTAEPTPAATPAPTPSQGPELPIVTPELEIPDNVCALAPVQMQRYTNRGAYVLCSHGNTRMCADCLAMGLTPMGDITRISQYLSLLTSVNRMTGTEGCEQSA